MSTILRVTNDNGVKVDLDILEEVPFRLDISAIESGNIGQVFGVSSQKITLPPTKVNNEFFGNLYDVGATPAASFTKTLPCQVLQSGAEIFTGKLYLDSVVTDNKGDNLYNVAIVNETIDFGYAIKDTTFSDLDFSSLDHTYTYNNITSSWDKGLLNGAVFYPLIDYGFDADILSDTQIKSGGQPRTFSNYNSPVRVDDFKPAIRLRDCLDIIFDSVGYDYTSSFFSSGSYTDDIYLLATKDDKRGISTVNPVSQSFLAFNNSDQDFADTQPYTLIDFDTELYDNASNWNTSTSTFTAGVDGVYQFKTQIKYEILNYNNINNARFATVRVYKNGSPLLDDNGNFVSETYNLTGTDSGIINIVWNGFDLEDTDTIQFYLFYTESDSGVQTFRAKSGVSTRVELRQGPSTDIGGDVDLSLTYGDISVPEFMAGLIEKFNLVIEPVENRRDTLRIETFNDWVDQGETKNWSNKVDYTQKWEITHPIQNQSRNIKFTDVEDNIAILQYHKRTTEKIYGEFDYNSDSDLSQDSDKTIGKLFAPTPMKGINGAPLTVMPALAEKDDSTQPLKRTKFAPRLFFHNGRFDANGIVGKNASGNPSLGRYYFKDENGTVHTETDYGLASHLQDVAADFDSTIDLHYGNVYSPGHYNYHQDEYNGRTKRTAYDMYWSFYINELYDVNSRLVTLNIFLDPIEIPNIKLNDKIFIDGHYYRINKINGANVSREDSIPVELIKSLPRKLKYPRRRIIIGDEPVDITIDDNTFSEAGTVTYSGFESGTTYSGSALGKAASTDGFQTYGTTVVWDTQKPAIAPFIDQTNVGLNDINKSAENVNARGDNNEIKNNVAIADIKGTGNIIEGYATNVSITGTDNTIEPSVENSSIINSTTSSISENTELATIISGEDTIISGSNKSIVIGQDLTVEGGNSNIVIGNIDNQAKEVKDLVNTTVINLNKDIESIENTDGDHYSGIAHIGTMNNVGAVYRDYAVITGSAGSSTDLSASPYGDAYYIHLTWEGGNGTHTLNLPSTAKDPLARDGNGYKRELRFFSDSTLSNNHKFRIQPSGSDVIDGTTFDESLDRSFDGITIFGTPGQWFTVQRKSK